MSLIADIDWGSDVNSSETEQSIEKSIQSEQPEQQIQQHGEQTICKGSVLYS